MSQAGTLLSDLDSSPGGGGGSDTDLVNQILADMNAMPSPSNPVISHQPPQQPMNIAPPMGNRVPMQPVQPIAQNFPTASDPAVPTAHMIGRDHPTPADFNAMMMNGSSAMMGSPYMQQQYQQPQQHYAPSPAPESKNWQSQWAEEFKAPLLVAICCLLVTLPAVNLLISHYAPKLLRPGGDLNTLGLITRAVAAGALFWFLQRVVAPLVAL
jgi:hypothetical protein